MDFLIDSETPTRKVTVLTFLNPNSPTRQARRALRAERARVAAELAAYRTHAERSEIYAILARHPDNIAEPLRQLID